jgi:hypothetical protein
VFAIAVFGITANSEELNDMPSIETTIRRLE